jgi:hypothetical protein
VIGQSAFEATGLTSVDIPASVAAILPMAFRDCSSLTTVYLHSLNPPAIISTAFYNIAAGTRIYVPAASLSLYQGAAGWSDIAGYIFATPW